MNQRRASSRKENIPVRQEPSVSAPPATISVIRTNSGFPSKSFSSMPATSNAGSFSGYLARPLETLRVSLDDSVAERITLHDLAETYNLVCERLKKLIFIGLDSEQGAVALESIRTSNSVLTKALLRDISRLSSHPFSSADESQMDVDFEVQDALDSASVGQHATRVLSEIVAFPALHSLFSYHQLSSLFGVVLDILAAPSLSTPHSNRTYALLLWLLQAQQLPINVLRRRRQDILHVLQRAINGSYILERTKLDGLRIAERLLRKYPNEFWEPCQIILPGTLEFLTSGSLEYRFQAAHTTSAFASAKLEVLAVEENDFLPSSTAVQFFLEKDEITLLHVLKRACARKKIKHPAKGPQWAIVTISSLTILLDSYIFWCSSILRDFLDCLLLIRKRQENDSDDFTTLHPLGWKCLLWAFSRIPPHVGRMTETAQEEDGMRDRAYCVIKQELRDGMGSLLVSQMLEHSQEDEGGDTIMDALGIIQDMVDTGEATAYQEGVLLLTRLVHAVGRNASKADDVSNKTFMLDQQLFDGSVLACKREKLKILLAPLNWVDPGVVRGLTEDEIILHWGRLVELWKKCVQFALEFAHDLDSNLFDIWQSLILVRSHLDADEAQLTISADLARGVRDVFTTLLSFVVEPDAESRRLCFLGKLWSTTARGFPLESLRSPAKAILSKLVTRNFNLSSEHVRSAWTVLCAKVAQTISPITSEDDAALEMNGWMIVAPIWIKECNVSLESLMAFTKIPFPTRLSSEDQLRLWTRLCQKVVDLIRSTAGNESREWNIGDFLSRLTDGKVDGLASLPRHTYALVAAIHIPGVLLPDEALHLLNDTLIFLYTQKSEIGTALRFIDLVKDILTSLPSNLVVSFVSNLEGLGCWMKDEDRVTIDDDYNDHLVSLYQVTLEKLTLEEASSDVINRLEYFLIAPFTRSPAPGIPFVLFKDFWLEKYRDRQDLVNEYTQNFKSCMRGLDKFFEGEQLVAYFSQTDSQEEPQSIVPETFESYADPESYHAKSRGPSHVEVDPQFPKEAQSSHDRFHTSANAESRHFSSEDAASESSTSSRKRKRMIMDCVEINSQAGSRRSRASRGPPKSARESQLLTPEPSGYSASSPVRADAEDQEDYGSWEEAISINQLEELKQEIETSSASNLAHHSPSSRPQKRQKITQRRLLPVNDTGATSPSPAVSFSGRLHRLESVYDAFANDHDIPVEELVRANKMLQRIATVVNKRLTTSNSDDPIHFL
ncbi:hypothetical protein VKT23_003848 [Stygiomarasmius scandens]|uniref:Telomere-associated protein Rif1 N-terminal domain-containing protein n=1 Tax=Marasmiellus scandens TaxID=2682957 RepID=A0ABR1K047_9AGAR